MRAGINRPDPGKSICDGLPAGISSTRPVIPTISTSGSHDGEVHLSPQFVDTDQRLSEELLLAEGLDRAVNTVSAPVYDGLPPRALSFPPEADMSMSPAAMFLSAFSPVASTGPLPDDEGEEVAGYTLGSIIGYGGFSTIRRATAPTGDIVAVKIVRRSDLSKSENASLARERLNNEATIWQSLSHENILPLFRSVHTSYADFFVMLYCPAGTLYHILKRDGRPGLPHDDAGMMFRQVVRGLRYLHEVVGIVHGDIKLENVLVDEMGVCRIGDFGMAKKIGQVDVGEQQMQQDSSVRRHHSVITDRSPAHIIHSKRHIKPGLPAHLSLIRHHSGPRHRNSSPLPASQVVSPPHAVYEFQPGSLPYASPELLTPPSSSHPYQPHPAQDMWALGVMLYALLTGRLPFTDSFEPRLQMKILHVDANRHVPFALPPECDTSRGRKGFRLHSNERERRFFRPNRGEPDLDILDEALRWTLSPDAASSRSRRADSAMRSRSSVGTRPYHQMNVDEREHFLDEAEEWKGRRAGSTPPSRTAPWAIPRSGVSIGISPAMTVARSSPHVDGQFVLTSDATPIPIPTNLRSRSVGIEAHGRHLGRI
ncbi:hypothetical protein EW146_g4429 [Bondarzewia mesenterica]|uniref:Protein kinase domain-containing protein n=1 Tax=Bondarzewia mesenterica TaxID=1095465 RepID=A0A4S4LWG7_9AGAM|nr:hypothetical protein EW146_g4429 [Bondarzewia mesenterica]